MNTTGTSELGVKKSMERRDTSSTWIKRLLVGVVILYIGVLILAPVSGLISGAFSEGLDGIIRSLAEPQALSAFKLTLWISLIVVIVQTVFGMIAALVLVRHNFPGKDLLNGMIDTPFAVSPVVVGYSLLLLFGRNSILAPVLNALDIKVTFALPGMILATLFVCMPFMIRELVPVLEAFGEQQERAAATLGANAWQIFIRVTFPGIRWGFIYGLTLTLARALGEFGAILVVGGGIQGRTETSTLYIFRLLEERQYIGAYSAALVLGLISMLLVIGTDILRRRESR